MKDYLKVAHNTCQQTCMQETKFRGQSVRMAKANAAKYNSLRIGNNKSSGRVDIFLAEVWMEKNIYIKGAVLIQITMLSSHGPLRGCVG